MVNKKAVIFSTIIALCIVGVILYMAISKLYEEKNFEEETEYSVQNNTTNTVVMNTSNSNESATENTVENVSTNNTNSDIAEEGKKDENEENDKAIVNEEKEESKTEKNNSKDSKNNLEDLAKKLVSDKENNPSNVYYSIEEEISNGVFIVSVRDVDTTEEVDSYKVNTSTKEITKN